MTILQYIIIILSSGSVAALISVVMQNKYETKQRIFNTKLEAYEGFIGYLEDYYASWEKQEKEISLLDLNKISAHVFLVGDSKIIKKIEDFNIQVSNAYQLLKIEKKTKEALEIIKEKVIPLSKEIEELMRKDLGFNRDSIFRSLILKIIRPKGQKLISKV